MNAQELCPICGEGHVTDQVQMTETQYKGHKKNLPLHFKLCDSCTSDFAGAQESKQNRRELMAFHKSVDGLLTGAEITDLRKRYKLTQAQAARLFGGGPVAFSKYENDDVAQSESMDTLLRLVRRSAVAFAELVKEKCMEAEFVTEKQIAYSGPKLVRVPINRFNGDRTPEIYNPREFRQFARGEVQCKP